MLIYVRSGSVRVSTANIRVKLLKWGFPYSCQTLISILSFLLELTKKRTKVLNIQRNKYLFGGSVRYILTRSKRYFVRIQPIYLVKLFSSGTNRLVQSDKIAEFKAAEFMCGDIIATGVERLKGKE